MSELSEQVPHAKPRGRPKARAKALLLMTCRLTRLRLRAAPVAGGAAVAAGGAVGAAAGRRGVGATARMVAESAAAGGRGGGSSSAIRGSSKAGRTGSGRHVRFADGLENNNEPAPPAKRQRRRY